MDIRGAPDLAFGKGNTRIDPAVVAHLPPDSEILSTEPHGTSFWAETGRIDVKLADDSIQTFFIKVLSHENGRSMVNGEFESMTALQNIVPGSVPRPIAWGSYETVPDTYFFLCEFRDMTGDLPDEKNFTSCLAKIHMNSQSPTGKFGFHVPTYGGTLSQENEWSDSWEAFFAKGMRHTLEYEILAHGPTTELANLSAIIFDKVIPRLLRPLESEGRSVKPCLVHGDLWYANTSTDATKDETIVFDACSLYAHNEYELGQWAPVCNRFGPEYFKAYHSLVPISEPVHDYQGRIDLYKLRFNLHVSALFPQDQHYREQVLQDMKDLVARYG